MFGFAKYVAVLGLSMAVGHASAGTQNRLGETPSACKGPAQSLDGSRMALVKQAGTYEGAASSSNDDSDGMAARFGCARI